MARSTESYSKIKDILNILERDLKKQKRECSIIKDLKLKNSANYLRYEQLTTLNVKVMSNKFKLYELSREGVFDSTYEAIILNTILIDRARELVLNNLKEVLNIRKNGIQIELVLNRYNQDAYGDSLNVLFSNISYTIIINKKRTYFTSLKGVIKFLGNRNIKLIDVIIKDKISSSANNTYLESHISTLEVC